jgi:hypothetical protein
MFLQPILSAMSHVSEDDRSSPGFHSMEKSKHYVLLGCAIATLSSTVTYINVIFMVIAKGTFGQDDILNPLVFMISMDSSLNCVGMLLVSGIPKAATRAWNRRVTTFPTALVARQSATPMPTPKSTPPPHRTLP